MEKNDISEDIFAAITQNSNRCSGGVCPVVAAISEIRRGGIWIDADEDGGHDDDAFPPRNRIVWGSSNPRIEYADEVIFYIMARKLDLARFELSNPTLVRCKIKAKSMFGQIGVSREDIYIHIVNTAMKRRRIYVLMTHTVEIITALEQCIAAKIAAIAKKGLHINVSLPGTIPYVDASVMYKPESCTRTANMIIDYIQHLNVNSILREPVTINMTPCDSFDTMALTGDVPMITASTRDEYLSEMKRVLNEELLIAQYVASIELYHCDVISRLSQVYNACEKIMNGLM